MDMDYDGFIGPQGTLDLKVIRAEPKVEKAISLKEIQHYGLPHKGLPDNINAWRSANSKRRPFLKGVKDVLVGQALARMFGVAHIEGTLFGKVIRANGQVEDLGLMGLNIVTTTGVGFIGDSFRNTVEPEIMKYHGLGTGATAEVIANTALQTELTTQYNPDNTRATGTLAGSANVYTTVGTNTVDAAASPVEWALLSLATGAAVMLDRVTFAAVALSIGDSLQTTFNLTFTAGG